MRLFCIENPNSLLPMGKKSKMLRLFHLVPLILALLGFCEARIVQFKEDNKFVTLENGFSKVVVDTQMGQITEISADFFGGGNFSANVLATPFRLEVDQSKLLRGVCADTKNTKSTITYKWLEQSNEKHVLKLSGVTNCFSSPTVTEDWTISLSKNDRSVNVDISGSLLSSISANYVSHNLFLRAKSLYGLFDRGVVQMMAKKGSCLGSNYSLPRSYFLGNGMALDVLHSTESNSQQQSTVVLHSEGSEDGADKHYSGFQEVIVGEYPNLSTKMNTAWSPCWSRVKSTDAPAGTKWTSHYQLIPNNFDFPVYALNNADNVVESFAKEESQSAIPFLDLQTYMMGIYASPVGCLQSYYDDQVGIVAPTIAHPDIGYSPNTNFFDPDNFLTMSAMLYSGEHYLMQQVKNVLQRTAETMCGIGKNAVASYCNQSRQRLHHTPPHINRYHGEPEEAHETSSIQNFLKANTNHQEHPARKNKNKDWTHSVKSNDRNLEGTSEGAGVDGNKHTRVGQLMHHFISLSPTYESIAGSEQLGPNIFWTWTALRYISNSQDTEWATSIFPYIDLSTRYLLTFIDDANHLVNAPGPLWIDVIVRENYTSDSSAALVPLFRLLADYYEWMQQDAEFVATLRKVADNLVQAVNDHLWASTESGGTGDHYITQRNPDGSIRDFVDYDSNLLTVAFNITTSERQTALLKRVDEGEHTHIRATWCSEVPYTGDACDCYIVGGTVCGDSVVTLARIGWVDALARKQIGDIDTFDNLLLSPLQADLVKDVWLYERYDANGVQIRTAFYFEYPALVTMMLREVRYGIDVGVSSVVVAPMMNASSFLLSMGAFHIDYSQSKVTLMLPGDVNHARPKSVVIENLLPSTDFHVGTPSAQETIRSDINGKLSFTATFSDNMVIEAVAVL